LDLRFNLDIDPLLGTNCGETLKTPFGVVFLLYQLLPSASDRLNDHVDFHDLALNPSEEDHRLRSRVPREDWICYDPHCSTVASKTIPYTLKVTKTFHHS
jgi:hypothetical protein